MATPVVTVTSGGLAVVEVARGLPVTESTTGVAVTKVIGKPGLAVTYVPVEGGGSGLLPAPSAPALLLVSGRTDNTPDFLVNGTVDDLAVGDVIRLQIDTDPAFPAPSAVTGTVTSGTSLTLATGALSDGTKYFRCRIERPGHNVSGWSNVETETIDTTAPVLSSPTGTKTGATTANLSVSTNEANGVLYWVVDTGSTPTAAQVKAGQGSTGSPANGASGNQGVVSTGAQTHGVTGLTASTTYKAYFMHEDMAGNQSTVAASSTFTTDASSGDVTTGLKSYWLFNEGSGSSTVADSVGGHTFSLSGGFTLTSDHIVCNGTGIGGATADHADFTPGSAITVFCWINMPVPGSATNTILAQTDYVTPKESWRLEVNASGKLRGIVSDDGTLNAGHRKNYLSGTTVANSAWRSVCIRFNGGTFDLFVDGVKETSPTKTWDDPIISLMNATCYFTFGAMCLTDTSVDLTETVNFMLKKARFYNIAKADADIAAMHALGP